MCSSDLLERQGTGRDRVQLVLTLEDRREVEFELAARYELPVAARRAIKAIPGARVQEV